MPLNKFFKVPFALSGDKAAIPDAAEPDGSVSYTEGFTVDYEQDPAVNPATAKDVPRDETNQLYFDITTALLEYQTNGIPDWITNAQNGGTPFSYGIYARVRYTNGKTYESRKAANTSLPTVYADWRPLADDDYLTIGTTAFEGSVADGEAVYWDAANSRFDEAIADGTGKQNVIGFADVTNGRVFVAGVMPGLLTGMTGNVVMYLSASVAGAITPTQPPTNTVKIGVARNATDLFINISSGTLSVASQAQVNARADNATAVTPLTLGNGYAENTGAHAGFNLPSWLGGWRFRFGKATTPAGGSLAIAFATDMGAAPLCLLAFVAQSGGVGRGITTPDSSVTSAGFTANTFVTSSGGSTGEPFYYLAITKV